MLIYKGIQKKNPITKCKAFKELDAFVSKVDPDSQEAQGMITFFLYHYCRIMVNEADKKVRESAQQSFKVFLDQEFKVDYSEIVKIYPIMFISLFDSSSEVAKIGEENLNKLSEDGGADVFKKAMRHFLHFANENLNQSEE